MTRRTFARTTPGQPRPAVSASSRNGGGTAITFYGCSSDEAALLQEMAPRFGVRATITEAPATVQTAQLATGARCVSVGHKTEVSRPALLALSRVGVAYLSTRSVGCNHIDAAYAQSLGVTVGTVAYSPDSVADYTLMLILMALRSAKSMVQRVAAHDYRLGEARGRELRDLTVGVVGAGRIGAAVIDRLRGFGCRILAHDNRPTSAAEDVSLDDLLRRSDVVSLHVPLTAGTRHLLDRGRIAQMRPGAIVVNTGRGALLDTRALLEALEDGRIGGAALDVVEGEEGIFYTDRREDPIDDHVLLRLHRLPNVLITPHTAFYTDRALSDTIENSLRNCLDFESENAA